MDLGIRGQRAAVAAGSSGLGFAAASALIDAGCSVAICGRDEAKLGRAAAQLGSRAVPLQVDVGSAAGGQRFVEEATAALGAVDILVTNAGGPPPGTFAETPLEAYQPALELSLLSVVGMCKAAVPGMRARGHGRVIAITSVSVRQPIDFLMLSNTARAGATGFLKTLALEVAAEGITVNSLQPGYHATDRLAGLPPETLESVLTDIPAGKLGDVPAFGQAVAFLASMHAGYITGAAIPIDGGSFRGLQ